MKVGLHSVTYLGLWYDGPGLTPLEMLRRARQLGFDGVELDARRPHANPMDLDAARRRSIRETCAELDLNLVAIAAHNDFSSPVLEHRECQMIMLREQVRLARDLGAPLVRVFLAWPGVSVRDGAAGYDVAQRRFEELWRESTWLEAWNNCKSALREAVRFAEEDGVVLALQNRPPIVRDHHDVLDMIAEVDSPWLRACIDAALLDRQDAVSVRQAALAAGAYLVHTHYGGEFARRDDGRVELLPECRHGTLTNYPAFVRALKEADYDGYLCFQFARPALDARRQLQGVQFVDQQAQLALEYMRDVVADAEAQLAATNGSAPTPAVVQAPPYKAPVN